MPMPRLQKSLTIALAVVAVLLAADLAVSSMVAGGGLDPKRFSVGDEDERPLVVTSTTVLDDMVLRVAGDAVRRVSIVGPGGDPHMYQPTPLDQIHLERADLVVLNGFGLEPNIERMAESVRQPHQHFAEAAAGLKPVYEDDDPHVPDPHLWMSPRLAKTYVDNIQQALAQLDPARAKQYEANAQQYKRELDLVDAYVRLVLADIPPEHRKLVTTHDAFRYFAQEYDLEVIDTVWGVTTDAEPSAQEIRALVDALRAHKVPAVFLETSVDPRILQSAAAEAGVRIGGSLYSDSLGLPGSGAHTYIGMLLTNAETLAEGLGVQERATA